MALANCYPGTRLKRSMQKKIEINGLFTKAKFKKKKNSSVCTLLATKMIYAKTFSMGCKNYKKEKKKREKGVCLLK